MKNKKTKKQEVFFFSLTPYQWEIGVFISVVPIHSQMLPLHICDCFIPRGKVARSHRAEVVISCRGPYCWGVELIRWECWQQGGGGRARGAGAELPHCMQQLQEVSLFPFILNFGSHPYVMLCSSSPVVFTQLKLRLKNTFSYNP